MEDIFSFELEGENYEFDREHAALFTYLGELAIYDHVFLALEEQEEDELYDTGLYLFKTMNPDYYQEVKEFLRKNHFPQHIDSTHIEREDVTMWEWMHLHDLRDYPPEWEE